VKITKGVVSAIWPDEDMPVDEEGIRADILISPDSVFNRMNPGQMIEQFLNRASELIRLRYVRGELGTEEQAFDYIMGYIHDVRAVYADFLMSQLRTHHQRKAFLQDVANKGIFLMIPPFCDGIDPHRILFLSEKYNITESRVSWNYRRADGSTKRVVSKNTVCIGAKYLYLLGKIPQTMLSAIEVGYVNQFNTPAKPKKSLSKGQLAYGQTPIRYGEDEICMMTMSLGPEAVARFAGVCGNSPLATEELAKRLLTDEKPSTLMRINMTDEDIADTNVNVGLFVHQMGAIGYDIGKTSSARDKRKPI
jgi:hypothetical protein